MKLKSIFRRSSVPAIVVILILLALALSVAGCGTEEAYQAQAYATQYARDGVEPPPQYQTKAAEYGYILPMTPTIIPTPKPNQNWTPTMSFYDYSGTQVAQQQAINSTQDAQKLELEREKLAAEERARQEAEDAKYAQETAVAYGQQQTAEARVFFGQQTANAESTQMMNTVVAQATATSGWITAAAVTAVYHDGQTQVAAQSTNAVLPTHAIWTQNAVYAVQTIEAGEAAKVELAVRRQNMKNVFDALLPWTIVVGAIIILARGFGEWVKTRIHSRDEHGAVPFIQLKTNSGDTIMVKPEDLETGLLKIGKDGSVIRYEPQDPREQSDIKRRNQAVEAIRALPTPYANTAGKIITSEFSSTHARVTMGNSTAMGPALDEANQGFIEEVKND